MAAAVLRTHGPAFEIASKRMAVVAGNVKMERRDDPLDPMFLASAMGHALGEQCLSDELRIILFKYFERELDSVLGDLYER